MAQFELAHCELYHPYIHGTVYNAEPEESTVHDEDYVYSSYLYHGNITLDEFYGDDYIIDIGQYPNPPHPFVRNCSGKLMEEISSKALWNYSASFGTSNFSIW